MGEIVRMKALTVWQPWTSLIIEGFKPREFRVWPLPESMIGQRVVLHAAKRPMKAKEIRDIMDYAASRDGILDGITPGAIDLLERVWRRELELPMSAGLGTVQLGAPRVAIHRLPALGEPEPHRPIYAWPMIDAVKWPEPIPMKGAQGFWEWPT